MRSLASPFRGFLWSSGFGRYTLPLTPILSSLAKCLDVRQERATPYAALATIISNFSICLSIMHAKAEAG